MSCRGSVFPGRAFPVPHFANPNQGGFVATNADAPAVFEIEFAPPSDGGRGLGGFIVGEENYLAHVAVEAILKGRPEGYRPVVLYGMPGCGKTHLADGLTQTWRLERTEPALATTGADFARGFGRAVETASVDEFREKFRSVSLLVIDDLQEMGGKATAQQELAQAIDAVLDAGGSVLATLDQSPAAHPHLEPRLASRLSEGLATPLFPPAEAARRMIISRIIHNQEISLSDDAIELLAANTPLTTPELRGVVLQLAEATTGNEIAIESVRNYVESQKKRSGPTLRTITARVSGSFKVKSADLKGPTRRRTVVRARGVAMFLARQLTSKSLQQVGSHFGGRDHTTVMHACRKTESLLKTDNEIRQHVEEITRQLT